MAARAAGRIIVNAQGIIEDADREARRILGENPEGRPIQGYIGDAQHWIRGTDGLEARRADGSTVPVALALGAGEGRLTIEIRDTSSDRREQERIRHSEAQLREAQQVGHIGNWVWDIRRDEITWSDELFRIYGLEPQSFEATFGAYMERIHPEDRELAQAVVQKAFEDHGAFSFDHRIVREDGEVRWLHGQGAVDVDGGQPVRMYGVSQDITQQRAAEELAHKALEKELEADHYKRLEAERSRLLTTMAHELNQPITPLRLQVGLLQKGLAGELTEQQRRALHVVDRNVTRLSVLLQDIMDVVRLQGAHLKLRRESTDVSVLAREVLETFGPEADQQGVRLEADLPEAAVANVDPARVTQILHNLVSNALKFTPEGKRIQVRLVVEEDDLVMEIEDTGAGLTAAQIGRLFRPFSQVHDDPTQPGTGLGLHICKGIAEEHGGSIEAISTGPGRGSTFRVRLPGKVELEAAV